MHLTRRRAVLASIAVALTCSPGTGVATADSTVGPGTVLAFGNNGFGQLGKAANAVANPTPAVVEIPGEVGPVAQVAAGFGHSLLLTASGQLYAFGDNEYGQLGVTANVGTRTPNPTPRLVSLPGQVGPIKRIATGEEYSLALTASGQLYSFGLNDFGQLGYDTNVTTTRPNATPALVALPGQVGSIVSISAGGSESAVLTASGQLYTFGYNGYGLLGRAPNNLPNPSPTVVQLPGVAGPIVQVAPGIRTMIVRTAAGQLFSWGDTEFGETGRPAGDGGNQPPGVLTLPGAVGAVTLLAAGAVVNFAVTSSNQLYAFGSNEDGQLGFPTGEISSSSTPLILSLPGQEGSITDVASGLEHGLAVTSTGQLYAWGLDFAGQLGSAPSATPPYSRTPSLVDLPPSTTIDAVASGAAATFTLALVSDLAVATGRFAAAQEGAAYNAAVMITGGTAPYRFTADGLPAGLSIDAASGAISGTPSLSGAFAPNVTVEDAYGSQTRRLVALDVSPATAPAPSAQPVPAAVVSVPPRSAGPLQLTRVKQSAARWTRGARLASLVVGSVARARTVNGSVVGTLFSFSLDRAGRVTFTFRRIDPSRTHTVGSLAVQARAGASALRFEGRVSHSLGLTPGRYSVTARTAGGAGRTLRFTVLR